jgi:uncharacterized protein YkwD
MLWLSFPGDMIIWGGAFARIPDGVIESARIDGANWVTELIKIILPMIWPTFALKAIMLISAVFGSSGAVFLLTNGENDTMTFGAWQYIQIRNSANNPNSVVYNYVSAIGILVTLVSMVLVVLGKWAENKLFKDTISTIVEFDVRDLESPVITSKKDKLQRSIHAELDPYQFIQVEDNDPAGLSLTYTTDYNNQLPGIYTITYTASDAAGNSSTLTLPVYVSQQKYTGYNQDSAMINEMYTLINEYRASYGLEPFELAPTNAHHALGVRACEARSFLSHDRPDGRHYKTTLNEYGVEYSSPFEILSFAGTSASDGLNWWKNSPDHNARLLTRISNKIAIGNCDGLWAAIVYND